MGFPTDVKEQALVATGRCCCLCHKFCGIKIELHHAVQKSEGGEDTFDNCIPLCFDCHADMRSYDHKHPKGTKYTPSELKKLRDLWYSNNRRPAAATECSQESVGRDISGLLEPPTAQDAVDRPASSEELLAALDQYPVVVLGGLSGSGKTYLAASQLARSCSAGHYAGVLWHDPSLGESVDNLLALLDEAAGLVGESTLSRCKALSVYLRKERLLLVIDNYHVVDQDSYAALLSVVARGGYPCRLLLLSQTYVTPADATSSVHHVPLAGLGEPEVKELLRRKNFELDDRTVGDLVTKTGGLPFAVSLFALLATDFGHDPKDLLSGAMESASRIRTWFDKILASLDNDARLLLTYLALLDVPFNVGVVKAVGRELVLASADVTFESLLRHFLVSRHTQYRWTVHELLRTLSLPLMSVDERADAHAMFGHYFLRGLSRRQGVILSTDEFLSKVRAFRHLTKSDAHASVAVEVLSELSATAKARGHYVLFVELSRAFVRADPAKHPWLAYHHGHCALILGHPDYCLRLIQPLLFNPSVVSNPNIRLSLTRLYAEALGALDRRVDAISVLREAMEVAPAVVHQSPSYSHGKTTLSTLLTLNGECVEAQQLALELLAEAQRKSNVRGGAIGWASLGAAQLRSGELSAAARALDAAKDMFTSAQDRRGMAWALAGLAECNLLGGMFAQAEQALRQAVAIATEIGECGVDLQERLCRMVDLDPPASIAELIRVEQQRIREQVAIKLSPLDF